MGEFDRLIVVRQADSSPFGSASEDFAKFETILLVGGAYDGLD